MNQNAVHKAQMRAFVKCVAINTGLGFKLWLDDTDIDDGGEDLSKHNIYAIRERMQQTYTKLVKRGLSTSEIAKMMGTSEQTVQYYLNGIFDEINRFEKAMSAL
jgi:DNA-binding transcriptional regulator YiaG